MANRRMLASDIFIDDFIGGLSHFERLVWIGMIASVADDQGRMMDNPALIRSMVFLYDSVQDSEVETAIKKISGAGKVVRYVANNKHLIQIVNWWKYQTPSWASPSKYPAPTGWIDRAKYHSVGNKIVLLNWDKVGGYVVDYIVPQDSDLKDGEVNDEGDDECDDESSDSTPLTFERVKCWLERITGLAEGGASAAKAVNDILALKGVIRQDIMDGYGWLKNQKDVKYWGQLVGPTHTAMSKRVNPQPNGHGKPVIDDEATRAAKILADAVKYGVNH